MKKTTKIDEEITKFEEIAEEWWNPQGKFKPLHMINAARINYIDNIISNFFIKKGHNDISILDIGCGGGLVSENLAYKNYKVSAIDASEKNIKIAKSHDKSNLVDYSCSTAEELAASKQKFDVVLALEIIEHVADIDLFLESCAQLVNNNGLLIISTLNKTPKSFLFAKIGAEYILRWLPVGTHDWQKFVRPSTIFNKLSVHNFVINNLNGIEYSILNRNWYIGDNLDVNYIMVLSTCQN